MRNSIPSYLLVSELPHEQLRKSKINKLSFLDKTLQNSAKAIKSIYVQAENAAKDNIIHNINPHIKLVSLLFLVIVISIVRDIAGQLLITTFIFILYFLSGLRIFNVYKKILFLTFIFGFLIVLPASLNVITPGKIILNLISFERPMSFWIYHIPQNIGFTEAGIRVVSIFFTRVLNSISFSFLVVFTTSFPGFIKSFKIVGIPDTFLMIIMLAYKYIFILSKTIEETYFALKSRIFGSITSKNIRKLISGRVLYVFRKSRINYENTYNAMVSRGYTGKIYLHSNKQIRLRDIIALLIVFSFGVSMLFI